MAIEVPLHETETIQPDMLAMQVEVGEQLWRRFRLDARKLPTLSQVVAPDALISRLLESALSQVDAQLRTLQVAVGDLEDVAQLSEVLC